MPIHYFSSSPVYRSAWMHKCPISPHGQRKIPMALGPRRRLRQFPHLRSLVLFPLIFSDSAQHTRPLDTDKRNMFWVGLLSAMARPESNFKPATKFTESFPDSSGRKVISRGLLQISIESANQSRYGCNIKKAEDLHIPAVNLACSVKILSAWVRSDNVIATYKTDRENMGGGRYWSVLRESQGHLPELSGFTSRLSFCKQAS